MSAWTWFVSPRPWRLAPPAAALALALSACLAARIAPPGGGPVDRDWIIREHLSGRPLDPVEGIWAWGDNEFEVAIVRNWTPLAPEYDYIGIVTRSHNLLTRPGEIKLSLNASASPLAFPGICRCPGNWTGKDQMGTTFLLAGKDFLTFSYDLYPDRMTYRLVRIFPTGASARAMPAAWPAPLPVPGGSGSGFFVAPHLVATALHVVQGAREILVHRSGHRWRADLWLADRASDLALLRLHRDKPAAPQGSTGGTGRAAPSWGDGEPSPLARCAALAPGPGPRAGTRVFAMGYPLGGLLGSEPHITEGIVTNTSGVRDEKGLFQLSNPIQPGQSGGPVFDEGGRVVGVITGSLAAGPGRGAQVLLPQNANFAVGSARLGRLMGGAADPACTAGTPGGRAPLSAAQVDRLLGPTVVRVEARL